MSDRSLSSSLPSRRDRDRGMTLPELLIAITVMGMIITVLSTAVIVTIKQEGNTTARLDVARAEQSIGLWMPADLASAQTVTTDPWASPCGATVCGGTDLSSGSNVVMLTWEVDGVTTNVSYHFKPSSDGTTYQLLRIECVGGVCTTQLLLTDLSGSPDGLAFIPGLGVGAAECLARDNLPTYDPSRPACTRPNWVMTVSAPLAADAIGEDTSSGDGEEVATKDARRVTVTINGGGTGTGGVNQISITAGGTTRREIDANSLLGAPSLVAARSRCGGPITLVVDESGSIGSTNIGNVRTAMTGFVDALIGTPVKIQIVRFSSTSRPGGSSDPWRKYYDMTVPTDVTALKTIITNFVSNGSTNWEDALFRTFYDPEVGGQAPRYAQQFPETVVFFTDGIPNADRRTASGRAAQSASDPLPASSNFDGPQWGDPDNLGNNDINTVSFNRAEYMASLFRSDVDLIGVGVGSFGSNVTTPFVYKTGTPYRNIYEKRATWTYERISSWTRESNLDFESAPLTSTVNFQKVATFQSTIDFEKGSTYQSRDFEKGSTYQSRDLQYASAFQTTNGFQNKVDLEYRTSSGASWQNATLTQYVNANTNNKRIGSDTNRAWATVTPAQYHQYRGSLGTSSQWQVIANQTAQTVTETLYDAYNTNNDSSDGWLISGWTSDVATYYTEPAGKRRVNGTNWVTRNETLWDTYRAGDTSNWQISAWADTTPALYYANESSAKYRINGSGWISSTETLWDTWAADNPTHWQISAWADTTPALYYASPGSPKFRISAAGRSAYSVTEAQYDEYNTTTDATDGWLIPTSGATWNNISPSEYHAGYTGPAALRTKYRISGTRTAYTVTSAEYALRNLYVPANWSLGTFADTTPTLYHTNNMTADSSDGWRINSPSNRGTSTNRWYTITSAEYDAYNTSNDESDGYRKTNPTGTTWEFTTQADFDLHESAPGQGDGYRKSPSGSTTWVATTKAEHDSYKASGTTNEKSGYRTSTTTSDVVDPDGYGAPSFENRRTDAILTHMITGVRPLANGTYADGTPKLTGGPGVPALQEVNGQFDLEQVQEAKMLFPSSWGAPFQNALKAIALGECGGSLTMQTKIVGAGVALDPFVYQNTWAQIAGGVKEPMQRTVTTNIGNTAAAIDFDIPSGQYVDLGMALQNFSELKDYKFDHWECRAGPTPRNAAPQFAVAGGTTEWPGIQIRVAANEAVSCIQWVKEV